MINRWEARQTKNVKSGESSPLAWLIDQKWWNKWERVTKESNNNQSEINEVISTLKTLKHPENERLGIAGVTFFLTKYYLERFCPKFPPF